MRMLTSSLVWALWHGLDVPHVWDIWGGFISLTSIPDISTALMRPRRPKQYCIYIYIYIYVCVCVAPRWHIRLRPEMSIAAFSSSFPVFPIVFISASIVLLHVSRGQPLFLLPLSGVHLNAVRVILSRSFLITCPSHLHLLCIIATYVKSHMSLAKNIPLADALSCLVSCVGETIADIDIQVHELHLHLNANPTRIAEIRNETVKDTN